MDDPSPLSSKTFAIFFSYFELLWFPKNTFFNPTWYIRNSRSNSFNLYALLHCFHIFLNLKTPQSNLFSLCLKISKIITLPTDSAKTLWQNLTFSIVSAEKLDTKSPMILPVMLRRCSPATRHGGHRGRSRCG